LVYDRHDRDRNRRVESAKSTATFSLKISSRAATTLFPCGLVVAPHQLELATEYTTIRVQLVDGNGKPTVIASPARADWPTAQ